MRRQIIVKSALFFIFIFFAASISAGDKKDAKSIFWKIESKTNRVYLLGSVHLADKSIYPLSKSVENAFDKSEILVVEADISKGNQQAIQQLTFKYGMYTPGKGLRTEIPKELYKELSIEMAKYGLDATRMDSFKPWLVATTLVQMKLMKMGFNSSYGIETHFMTKKGSKKLIELESIEFQLKLFATMSKKLQILMLKETLEDKTIGSSFERKCSRSSLPGLTNFSKPFSSYSMSSEDTK